MIKLSNMKIKRKMNLLTNVLLCFTVLMGVFGYIELTKANDAITSMYNNNLRKIDWLNDNRNQSRAIEADLYYIILSDDSKDKQKEKLEDIQTRNQMFDDNFQYQNYRFR